MNDMIVKSVDLMGDTVMAAQDKDGNIWAGVNFFCRGLGMSKRQRDFQVEKVKSDKALSRGCTLLRAGVLDPANEAYALRIDFIPIWLSKITITKKMEQETPELADKLLEYQLKAKDILAEAFMPKQNDFPRTTQAQIQLLAQGNVELNQRVDDVEIRIKDLENTMTLDHGQQYFLEKTVNKTVMSALGGKESNAYKQIGRKVFAECNGNLKAYFKVNARGNVPRKRYDEAVAYAEKWKPCMNTQMMIEQYNAQQTLDLEGGVYHG